MMNFNNDYNLHEAFSLERKLLLYAGFYPYKQHKYKKLYYFSAFVNLLISYGQLLTMIIQMIFDRGDLSKLTESLLYFFTHFTFLCKLFNFQYHEKNIIEIENFLTDPAFYGHTNDQLEIIKNRVQFTSNIAKIYRFLCTSTCTFYGLVPFIDDSRKLNLPLPGWFPYDTQKFYFVTYAFQMISMYISAYCNSTIDVIFWKMITVASAQFEILKENLSSIDYNIDSVSIEKSLIKCVKHHKKIVSLTKQIQDTFSKGIFLQFFGSVIVICTTLFQMIVVPIPSIQFVVLVSYLGAMNCQVGTYCWYGHDVMTTSDTIGISVYMSNWFNSSNKIRKILTIFLENTKKPFTVRAGNFITLSLQTLTQILRSSYSYFAVLQRLYADSS